MTEAEWLACTHPEPMLDFAGSRMSPRKVRLFVVSCVWRIIDLLDDSRSKKAIKVAARFADGVADENELRHAYALAGNAAVRRDPGRVAAQFAAAPHLDWGDVRWAIHYVTVAIRSAAEKADRAKRIANPGAWMAIQKREQAEQVALLRDSIGNPFRPTVTELLLQTWNCVAVTRMAQTIYDERRFSDLPILADALEEAGCDNADLLAHCRGPGPHARGCWVVDLLLGKT
jgi:hypothetical protein